MAEQRAKRSLTLVETTFIETQMAKAMPIAEIAKHLGRTTKVVQRYADQHPLPPPPAPVVEEAPKMATVKDLMVSETAGKREGGVAIMTHAASELADAQKTIKSKPENRRTKNAIHKIR